MSPSTLSPLPKKTPRTILSILIDEGYISKEQAALLPPAVDNAAIEELLISRQLVDRDDIVKAYATLYNLPFVHLKDRKIKPDVLELVPEIIARRYDIVAYHKEKDLVMVAIATPSRLKPTPKEGLLRQLQNELKMKIALAVAPIADIRAAHALYEAKPHHHNQLQSIVPLPLPNQVTSPSSERQTLDKLSAPIAPGVLTSPAIAQAEGALPVVSLLDMVIPIEVLKKFPKEIVKKYAVVPFAEPEPGHLFVAATRPNDPAIQELLRFVEKQNQIKLTLHQTDEPSLTHALIEYDHPPVTTDSLRPQSKAALPGEKGEPTKTVKPVPTVNGVPEIRVEDITPTKDQLTPLQAEIYKPKPGQAHQPGDGDNAKLLTENTIDTFLGKPVNSLNDLVEIIRSGNIPKTVAATIALAVNLRSSDVHVEATKDKVRLRYRIDGELEDILFLPRTVLAPLVSRIKILSKMKIDENRIPQDGRFDVRYKGRDIDLRVSTLPTVHGEKVVMRILDKTTGIMSLEDMGLDGEGLERVITNIGKPYGIILATGPTGSGKSTTLYAILQRIAKTDVNVVTLEDPVEYEIKGTNQTQIKPKIGFTFAEGLRSILRQDPNIIMVGEIRDKETAEMATHSALTGHLVLSTLHTNTAAGALPRLINMGIEPFLITSSMNAIIGQRLVRRVCQNCKVEDTVPQGVVDEIRKELEHASIPEELKDASEWKFYKGQECAECNHGYKGRIGVFEVLVMSSPIEELAVKKEPASSIEEQALKEGMITMKQDGLVKALKGLTTIEEVMKATTE